MLHLEMLVRIQLLDHISCPDISSIMDLFGTA